MKAQPVTDKHLSVIHSVPLWLNQTVTWLYTLVKNQSPRIEYNVISHRLKNLEQFPYENLVSLERDLSIWKLLSSKSWKIRNWRQNHLLFGLIRRCNARIIHSHFGNHAWGNLRVVHHAGLKHAVTFYGYDASLLPQREPIWRERFLELFEAAHMFLCEGPYFGKTLIKLGCPADKIRVQHLGVDLEKIRFGTRNWHSTEPLKILLAGTFVEKKGMPYAIEALGRIKNKVNLEITIIGDDNGQDRSIKEKAKIIQSVRKSGLESRTRLLGYQPHDVLLREAYINHLFLSPSVTSRDGDTEGGAPVTIIEMAASGMPVVSTFHCDIPEVIQDGKSGLLAQERDVDELESKLVWLIENPERWSSIAATARERIENEFDSVVQGNRLANHYLSLFDS